MWVDELRSFLRAAVANGLLRLPDDTSVDAIVDEWCRQNPSVGSYEPAGVSYMVYPPNAVHSQFAVVLPSGVAIALGVEVPNHEADALFGLAIGPEWRKGDIAHPRVLSRLVDVVVTVELTTHDCRDLLLELQSLRGGVEKGGASAVAAWWKIRAVAEIAVAIRSELQAFCN